MKDSLTIVLPNTPQLKSLFTVVRDRTTKRKEFAFHANRILRLIVDQALNILPTKPKKIITGTGVSYLGSAYRGNICCVSILRSGEAMEEVVRDVCPGIKIGKILIQRNEKTAQAKLFFAKLPKDIAKRWVLLLDPMLGTGGSASAAIDVLKQHAVSESKIIFLNLISCPEGLNVLRKKYPKLRIVTACIDPKMNKKHYLVPGIGDFGDRFYGTD